MGIPNQNEFIAADGTLNNNWIARSSLHFLIHKLPASKREAFYQSCGYRDEWELDMARAALKALKQGCNTIADNTIKGREVTSDDCRAILRKYYPSILPTQVEDFVLTLMDVRKADQLFADEDYARMMDKYAVEMKQFEA